MSLYRAVELAGPIPADTAKQSEKKAYSELLSRELAFEIADTLREEPIFRNISPRRPKNDEPAKQPNAKLKRLKQESPEKYFLGGFGRKKLDVSLAHEQDGLLLAVSVKTITSRDARTRNYNKNFKNRFGDLCAEATSVHMRSPYTVMCGIFAMPAAAAFDDTSKRRSTASRAMKYLRSISGRVSHEQSPERFEYLVFALFEPSGQGEGAPRVSEAVLENVSNNETVPHPYRLFDVWEQRELTLEEYAKNVRTIYLARNPFLDE